MLNIFHNKWILLVFVFVMFNPTQNVEYRDVAITEPSCPNRNRCRGYLGDMHYLERSCECDSVCHAYGDCCADVRIRDSDRQSRLPNIMCLNYNEYTYDGVYVVSKCSMSWKGAKQTKEKCEGSADLSDLISAAPVTSMLQRVTYKNLYCAACNYAPMESLKLFAFKIECEGIDVPRDQLIDKLFFNERRQRWGINREDNETEPEFVPCDIHFEIPSYMNTTVRYCRANVISNCARGWTRNQVKRACEEYMAVVFDNSKAYRNPHCARCNNVALADLKCFYDLLGRRRPFSFATLIDVNRDYNSSTCPPNHIYDPYVKRCKKLTCALPGYVIRDGKCSPGR